MTGKIGTPAFMSPEMMTGSLCDESLDVYSFGILLWCLWTREQPFLNLPSVLAIIHGVVTSDLRPALPDDCPARAAQLMRRCWAKEKASRPRFAEIVSVLDNDDIFDALQNDDEDDDDDEDDEDRSDGSGSESDDSADARNDEDDDDDDGGGEFQSDRGLGVDLGGGVDPTAMEFYNNPLTRKL
jgi:serine/threonine protein kinase